MEGRCREGPIRLRERLGKGDGLAHREREHLTRVSVRSLLLADDALRQRIFDRVPDGWEERRINRIEADDFVLVRDIGGVHIADARLDDGLELAELAECLF